MKKSNKALLITVISLLVIILFPQWILYRKFEKKDFRIVRSDDSLGRVKLPMAAPRVVYVKGVCIATVIPADTFAIEYSTKDDGKSVVGLRFDPQGAQRHPSPRFYHHDDTLVIDGADTVGYMPKMSPAMPLISKAYWVRIYCRHQDLIKLDVEKSYLQGDTVQQKAPSFRLLVINSSVELGSGYPLSFDPNPQKSFNYAISPMSNVGYPTTSLYAKQYYYDSLTIIPFTSNITLQPYCQIRQLNLDFSNDNSSFTDNKAPIGKLLLNKQENNSYTLSGSLLLHHPELDH